MYVTNNRNIILSRIIWHEGDEGTVNDHVRMIVKLYHRVIKKSVISLKPGFMSEYLRKLVGMVAQLVDMCAKTKDDHALRKELAETIGSEFNASCSGIHTLFCNNRFSLDFFVQTYNRSGGRSDDLPKNSPAVR